MFQLIIVDDEILAISALRNCVDWNFLGFDKVFTASSSYQAKEIFRNNRIDILLCDIEMPQENGLELLSWVRENSPDTESIIQSCHTDFKYTRKAMQLESIDYILKPVLADDLISAVDKAIKKIESTKSLTIHKGYQHVGSNWKAPKESRDSCSLVDDAPALKAAPKLMNSRRYMAPDISYWAMLLGSGLKERLNEAIHGFLQDISEHLGYHMDLLTEIRKDFIKMVYEILEQKGIQPLLYFNDNKTSELFETAEESIQNMAAWMEHVISGSIHLIQDLQKEKSIIEKSIRYIKLHVDQDIKREDVAASVYLHPNSLTRVFKKETGMSITEYIINERINISKKLLENTDMTVSSIAIRVGYSNFSHFAKTFRKHVGMNPIDYKNNISRE